MSNYFWGYTITIANTVPNSQLDEKNEYTLKPGAGGA
jgi:hypothetical protein